VACGNQRSFVMADIPGLIEGAADGAGLGIRFLKHLQRTRVLLHLVDIAPVDPNADPVRDARAIVGELGKFSEDLLSKPRWLVINKSDLLPPEEATARAIAIAQELDYPGPVFLISGVTHNGTSDLTEAVMRFLETAEAPERGNLDVPRAKPRRVASPPKAVKRPVKKAAAKKKAAAARKKVVRKAAKKSVRKPVRKTPVKKSRRKASKQKTRR
jgi:GTPase involved in cell partitioning and DNA repair